MSLQLEANLFGCAAFKRYAKSANKEKLSWINTLSASQRQFSQYWPLKKIYERVISTLADAVEVPLWTRLALNRYVSWSDHFFPKDLSSVKAFQKNQNQSSVRADSCWPGTEGRPGAAPVARGTAQDEEGWVRGCRWVSWRSPRPSPERVSSNRRLDEQRRSRADGQRWNTEASKFHPESNSDQIFILWLFSLQNQERQLAPYQDVKTIYCTVSYHHNNIIFIVTNVCF